MGLGAAHAPEAVAAIDGLAARRAERDLGLAAAVAAGSGEHLARPAVTVATAAAGAVTATAAAGAVATGRVAAAGAVATVRPTTRVGVPGGLAACPARRAAARLGKATLRVEVLLGRREHEFL